MEGGVAVGAAKLSLNLIYSYSSCVIDQPIHVHLLYTCMHMHNIGCPVEIYYE